MCGKIMHNQSMHVCMHACMHICAYVYVYYAYLNASKCACRHLYGAATHLCMSCMCNVDSIIVDTCMHPPIYGCVCMCLCLYACICIRMYVTACMYVCT